MVVPAPVVEVIHANSHNAGLVPPDSLLPHPDGVVAALEVQVGVLLSTSVNVLRLIPNYFYPEPFKLSLQVFSIRVSEKDYLL